jgi:hypothetical protein
MTTTATPIDYLAVQAKAIADRESATTSGAKAAASRRVGLAELELDLAGISYKPYTAPTMAGQKPLTDLSDAEVKAAHFEAVKAREEAQTSGKKAAGSLRVSKIEQELTKRSIEFTPARFARGGASAAMSFEDLAKRVHALRSLIARDTVRPRIKKVAQSELRVLTDQASERGVPISDSVAADSDAVASLDSGKATKTTKR